MLPHGMVVRPRETHPSGARRMKDGSQLGNSAVYQFKSVKMLRDAKANHLKIVTRYKDAEGLLAPFKPDASG